MANNLGVKYLTDQNSKYIFFINPDIFCERKDVLQKMIDYMDKHPHVGILGPKQIIRGSGEVELVARNFPDFITQAIRRTRLRNWKFFQKKIAEHEQIDMPHHSPKEVDWLQSSFILIRRTLWERLGGFSDIFFLFMADVEICFQAWKKGEKVVYFPNTEVTADGIRCSEGGIKNFFRKKILRLHAREGFRFWVMHFLERNPRG